MPLSFIFGTPPRPERLSDSLLVGKASAGAYELRLAGIGYGRGHRTIWFSEVNGYPAGSARGKRLIGTRMTVLVLGRNTV